MEYYEKEYLNFDLQPGTAFSLWLGGQGYGSMLWIADDAIQTSDARLADARCLR